MLIDKNQHMYIIAVVLYIFWVLMFVTASNRLYEIIKYRDKVLFREWIQIIGCIIMPIWFFFEKFLADKL